MFFVPRLAARLDIFKIDPPSCSADVAACDPQKYPNRFVSKMSVRKFLSIAPIERHSENPALLM